MSGVRGGDSSSSGAGASVGVQWLVRANRLISIVLAALGIVFVCVGVYLGLFAWLNDGAAAGLELMLVVGGFGSAFLAGGICFRIVAKAHATGSPRGWWLQALSPLVAFILFGLAAELSSIAEDLAR